MTSPSHFILHVHEDILHMQLCTASMGRLLVFIDLIACHAVLSGFMAPVAIIGKRVQLHQTENAISLECIYR